MFPKCAEGGHLLPPGGTLLLTCLQPLPPQPATGRPGAPSLWPPSTLLTPGEALSHPSSAPQNPRGPATAPGCQTGKRPSRFPSGFSMGHSGQNPMKAPLSTQPKQKGQIKKNKNQIKGDKCRGAGCDGTGDLLYHLIVTAPLLCRERV